jgi:exosome complex RNA-binding protein Rrp42 (RNase PH superfamily)
MADETTQLVLLKAPISVTLGLFDSIFITDPNSKEEEIIRGRITCAIAEDDSICLITQVSCSLVLFISFSIAILLQLSSSFAVQSSIENTVFR